MIEFLVDVWEQEGLYDWAYNSRESSYCLNLCSLNFFPLSFNYEQSFDAYRTNISVYVEFKLPILDLFQEWDHFENNLLCWTSARFDLSGGAGIYWLWHNEHSLGSKILKPMKISLGPNHIKDSKGIKCINTIYDGLFFFILSICSA